MTPHEPKLTYANGLWYLLLEDRPVHRTVELHCNLFLDLDADNRLVGVEGMGPVQWPMDLYGFSEMVTGRYSEVEDVK